MSKWFSSFTLTRVSSAAIKSAWASVSTARQVAIYVVREITGMTQLDIGREFGGRDHSTVVYALQQTAKTLQSDPRKKEMIEDIIKNIRNLNA